MSTATQSPAYRVKDLRGTNQPQYKAGGLYPNPRIQTQMRPRFYSLGDTSNSVDMSTRSSMVRTARELFASMATVGGAIVQKNEWSTQDGWMPQFKGENTEWGTEVEAWLKDKFFPVCNTRGGNHNFLTTLFTLGCSIDVDGDALIVATSNRDGFPQIQVVPAHRLGTRNHGEKEVKAGRYKGLRIIDGIILSSAGKPIAYRILGDKPEDDYDISAQSALHVAEHTWSDAYRGIPRLARIAIDLMDAQDTEALLRRQVKLDSSLGITHHTPAGTPDESAILGTEDTGTGTVAAVNTGLVVEAIDGGSIMYMTAGTGEKIDVVRSDRPNTNVTEFLNRIERRCLYAMGWPVELLDPSKVGGGSVRLIQDLARKSIKSRQATIERVAKFIVTYAVSKAMDLELIPANYDDTWYNFSFTRPAAITVDAGNEASADRDGIKLGITTLASVTAKQGNDWQEIRNQTQRETEDLLSRATFIANKYSISLDKALSLLSQRTPNEAPAIDAQGVDRTNN